MFEVYALELLRYGGNFRRKNLATHELDEVRIQKGALKLTKGYPLIESNDSAFYVSTRLTEAADDYIAQGHLMNATVSTKHDFKITSGNVHWLDRLNLTNDEWDICLIVPADLLDSIEAQPITRRLIQLPRKRARGEEETRVKAMETNRLIEQVFERVSSLPQYAIGIPNDMDAETISSMQL
jgi:hypothetical protein